MTNQEMIDLLWFSPVAGAKALASKVQAAELTGTEVTLSEDEQRILDEAQPAPASDPDLDPQPAA